jgi:hypothetical protein
MVLAIYQIILHLNKITECLKMTTFKIVFTSDVFFSAETTMHCKMTCIKLEFALGIIRFELTSFQHYWNVLPCTTCIEAT